jgi:uncharacterized protein (TIGR02147 family)
MNVLKNERELILFVYKSRRPDYDRAMEHSIFAYEDYKTFLLDRIDSWPGGGRGVRRLMAEAMGCQVAYVSHILVNDRHLSIEQAEALTRFLALRMDEAEYFVLLVEYNRAGTHELRQFFRRQLKQRREQNQKLKNRVVTKGEVSPVDQAQYYSSWHYQAVRMLLSIPGYRSPAAIAGKLQIDVERVNEILSFLLDRGLIAESAGQYRITSKTLHLGDDSPLISKLHANWRIKTLQKLDRRNAEDLHYSSVVSLSHSDFAKVREILVKAMLSSHKVIGPSAEERLCVFALDFYEL